MREEKYWLKANAIPGATWSEVSKEDWINAERAAGFRPKLWSGDPGYMTTCATGGFSNSADISGTITHDGNSPKH
ncbi:hypothetical protein IVB27_32585 [Bradyrhizobium sp. 197]|uniref:hypothetical protein n=1 Tax=Bradyrhizobium sp. 197 TaxID=2782663 RepID=UPI001FF7B421|nr:hypothetical protein [Bradyrhizobium sp. 197]MCK1479353.1 hypothetical protein [Bradyrhizobium sp. 197]